MKKGGGAIDASVQAEQQPAKVSVLLLPNFPSVEHPRMCIGVDGTCSLVNVAPGEYTLYAFESVDEVEYGNPEVMSRYTGGTRVQINGTSRQKITIGSLTR